MLEKEIDNISSAVYSKLVSQHPDWDESRLQEHIKEVQAIQLQYANYGIDKGKLRYAIQHIVDSCIMTWDSITDEEFQLITDHLALMQPYYEGIGSRANEKILLDEWNYIKQSCELQLAIRQNTGLRVVKGKKVLAELDFVSSHLVSILERELRCKPYIYPNLSIIKKDKTNFPDDRNEFMRTYQFTESDLWELMNKAESTIQHIEVSIPRRMGGEIYYWLDMPDSLCSIIHKLPKQKGHILIGEMLYISGGMPIVADDWEISSATEKYHKVRDWYDSYLKYNQNNGIRLEDILRG